MLDLEYTVTPKTKIVYLVRDPRAVFASLLRFYNELIAREPEAQENAVDIMELAEDFLGIGKSMIFLLNCPRRVIIGTFVE